MSCFIFSIIKIERYNYFYYIKKQFQSFLMLKIFKISIMRKIKFKFFIQANYK
jgi:hypothetical protein